MSGGAMYDDSPDGLLALANSIAGLVGAPVTIEDDASELITYSPGQEYSDDARVATILSRRVPDRYRPLLRNDRLDVRLAGSSVPLYADFRASGAAPDVLPRAIMPIRVDDLSVGSIWAIVPTAPSREQRAALEEAAALAAPVLARQIARRRGEEARRAAAVRALLGGGAGAVEAAAELPLAPGPLAVVALRPLSPAPSGEPLRRALAGLDGLAGPALGGVHAEADGAGYAVLPVRDEQRLARVVRELQDRSGLVAGVGRTVPGPDALDRSRADADLVVRLLTRLGGAGGAAAHIRDVHLDALLMQTVDLADEAGHDPLGAIAELERYDRERGTDLLDSLARYLAAGEDARLAARQLHVHPNTLRYRLRRAHEIAGLDLTDPAAKFEIQLRLRLRALRLP
ncbi:PucR family transcriptional regulator [Streptomyces sp. RTd22]|uniref:PucR family transcriptional regulator n=1 Tax=Streptomyces sp. RTd22 TaxID=1841249 RepID=UPI00131BAA6B|nr:helix-turn-helix domain-containing protein [Streptomyces sp. RTd22]